MTHDDVIALVSYDENTGLLLKADPATGQVDERRIEELRAAGTILRLLENQLIYPGGKLTASGIEEARRLAAVAGAIPRRPAATDIERDHIIRETEYSLGRAVPFEAEPEPHGGSALATITVIQPKEESIGAFAASLNPQNAELPLERV